MVLRRNCEKLMLLLSNGVIFILCVKFLFNKSIMDHLNSLSSFGLR